MLQLFLHRLPQPAASHSRRTLLLGGAIAGVTALLVMLIGLSNGIKATMLESATTLMTGHVNVGGFYKVTAGQAAPVVTDYPEAHRASSARRCPSWTTSPSAAAAGPSSSATPARCRLGIGGIDIAAEPGFRKVIQVREGNLDDLRSRAPSCIFEEQAKKLEVKVGDTLTLSAPTMRGVNNTVDVRVVAIAANVGLMSSLNIFVPSETLRALYQLNDDATGALHLYLKDMTGHPRVQAAAAQGAGRRPATR